MPAQAGIQGWQLGGNTQSLDFVGMTKKKKSTFEILSKWRKFLEHEN